MYLLQPKRPICGCLGPFLSSPASLSQSSMYFTLPHTFRADPSRMVGMVGIWQECHVSDNPPKFDSDSESFQPNSDHFERNHLDLLGSQSQQDPTRFRPDSDLILTRIRQDPTKFQPDSEQIQLGISLIPSNSHHII